VCRATPNQSENPVKGRADEAFIGAAHAGGRCRTDLMRKLRFGSRRGGCTDRRRRSVSDPLPRERARSRPGSAGRGSGQPHRRSEECRGGIRIRQQQLCRSGRHRRAAKPVGAAPRTAAEVYDAADVLVQRGLRAQVSDTQLLGGEAIITLDIQPGAPPATLDRSGKLPELPAGPTQQERIAQKLQPLIAKLADAPIDQMFTQLQEAMAALNQLISGPELRGALEELRGASTDLRNVVDRLGARSDTLIASLNGQCGRPIG